MSKYLTKEQQKENALKFLQKIECYKPYLKAFEKGIVTMYEGYGGYYIDEKSEPELCAKIAELEKEYKGTCYAVIHNVFEFGECYTLLWSTQYPEDVKYSIDDWGDHKYGVFALVWNKDGEFEEFGTVGIKSALGGLLRIA